MFSKEQFYRLRDRMVEQQLRRRDITDPLVLHAMRLTPRHHFVPPARRTTAYDDRAFLLGPGQMLPTPYLVATMTQLLGLNGGERVLEIGTGCGYQTALLCEIAGYVYTLERDPLLATQTIERILALGYENFDLHVGDASQGLADMAPFDAILVTAAMPRVPGPLVGQLNPVGGRLVLPVGDRHHQRLCIVQRFGDRCKIKQGGDVRFLPLNGRYGFRTNDDKPSLKR